MGSPPAAQSLYRGYRCGVQLAAVDAHLGQKAEAQPDAAVEMSTGMSCPNSPEMLTGRRRDSRVGLRQGAGLTEIV